MADRQVLIECCVWPRLSNMWEIIWFKDLENFMSLWQRKQLQISYADKVRGCWKNNKETANDRIDYLKHHLEEKCVLWQEKIFSIYFKVNAMSPCNVTNFESQNHVIYNFIITLRISYSSLSNNYNIIFNCII